MRPVRRFSCPFILASRSPRRKRLLEQTAIEFQVQESPADEAVSNDLSPPDVVRTLALRKASPVARAHPTALVLTADTAVDHNGEVLGKPAHPNEAHRMLQRLSGTTHRVHTAFALTHASSDRQTSAIATTEVTFARLSDREITAYVDSRSPLDKAGGYGIQDHTGPLFVKQIKGAYYTVVGLPLRLLYQTLQRTFGDLLEVQS